MKYSVIVSSSCWIFTLFNQITDAQVPNQSYGYGPAAPVNFDNHHSSFPEQLKKELSFKRYRPQYSDTLAFPSYTSSKVVKVQKGQFSDGVPTISHYSGAGPPSHHRKQISNNLPSTSNGARAVGIINSLGPATTGAQRVVGISNDYKKILRPTRLQQTSSDRQTFKFPQEHSGLPTKLIYSTNGFHSKGSNRFTFKPEWVKKKGSSKGHKQKNLFGEWSNSDDSLIKAQGDQVSFKDLFSGAVENIDNEFANEVYGSTTQYKQGNATPSKGNRNKASHIATVPSHGIRDQSSYINIPSQGIRDQSSYINVVPSQGISDQISYINVPSQGIRDQSSYINVPSQKIRDQSSYINVPSQGIRDQSSYNNGPSHGIRDQTSYINVPTQGIQDQSSYINVAPSQDQSFYINSIPTQGKQFKGSYSNAIPSRGTVDQSSYFNSGSSHGIRSNDAISQGSLMRGSYIDPSPAFRTNENFDHDSFISPTTEEKTFFGKNPTTEEKTFFGKNPTTEENTFFGKNPTENLKFTPSEEIPNDNSDNNDSFESYVDEGSDGGRSLKAESPTWTGSNEKGENQRSSEEVDGFQVHSSYAAM